MRYCKDCKWFKVIDCWYDECYVCTNPSVHHVDNVNEPVLGPRTQVWEDAKVVRNTICGEEAKYYEPSFWFKLKSLFSKSNNKE